MTLAEAKSALIETAQKNLRHPNYQRTLDIAMDCLAYSTGKGLDEKLQKFVKREDDEAFSQRVLLTKHIVQSVCGNISSVFEKVFRSHYQRILQYPKADGGNSKMSELETVIEDFNGDLTLDEYAKTRFYELNQTDPNAWCVVEFDPFKPGERAKPYPFEVSSEMAVNYRRINNVLQWLIAKTPHSIPDENGTMYDAERYTIYASDRAALLEQVSKMQLKQQGIYQYPVGENGFIVLEDGRELYKFGDRLFIYTESKPHLETRVPAKRFGFIRDKQTAGDCCLPIYHLSSPWFEKIIKQNSELDLTMCLLAYPQRIRYAPACDDPDCNGGHHRATGDICRACHGTGTKNSPTSAQDEIVLKMPMTKDDMLSLDGLLTFKSPPTDILKTQIDYLDSLMQAAKQATFNSDIFTRQEVQSTATGKNLDMQNVYDVLSPFAQSFASFWLFLIETSAKFTYLYQDLSAALIFPKDFKLKSSADLLLDLESINRAEAGAAVRSAVQNDIARIMYADDPLGYKRYRVKETFNPVRGLSEAERTMFITSDLVPKKDRVFVMNFESIFAEAEMRFADFYEFTEQKQRQEIELILQDIMNEIGTTAAPVLPIA